jgi:hypothetical protein
MDAVKFVYEPITTRAARHALVGRMRLPFSPERGRFTRDEVTQQLDAAWKRYDEAVRTLPVQPTRGSTMNMRLACFTFSFFEQLLTTGIKREYAIELVADATWQVYRMWARLTAAVSQPASGKVKVHLRVPFNVPGYVIETVLSEVGTAFDVIHCPVASYFRDRGAADLCVASWCNLDFALSELTHQKLVRTKTLVQGADRCDFRVLPAA